MIFVGTMDYFPNVDAVQYFVKDIFPLIREKFPHAVFQIVGRSPTKAVRRLRDIDGVQVVGEVDDIRTYLVQADLSVAPMRVARGVQNKVLEAMAMGVPVVASPSATQGIEVFEGDEVLIGSSPEEFAFKVITLLADAELRRAITKRAWKKMKQLYNWDTIGLKLETFLIPPVGETLSSDGNKIFARIFCNRAVGFAGKKTRFGNGPSRHPADLLLGVARSNRICAAYRLARSHAANNQDGRPQ